MIIFNKRRDAVRSSQHESQADDGAAAHDAHARVSVEEGYHVRGVRVRGVVSAVDAG